MQIVNKNMWEDADNFDYVCITTNSVLDKHGHLVMGKGIAKQAVQHIPELPMEFGKIIRANDLNLKLYGILIYRKYIAFQTKINWRNDSELEYVQLATNMLNEMALSNPDKSFALPYPAISCGNKDPKDVYRIIKHLPDNVTVYHLRELNINEDYDMELSPEKDGLTHLNIYSKAMTPLGVALSNMTLAPFSHNGVKFNSVEQAWHFYKFTFTGKTEQADTIMRYTSPFRMKSYAKKYNGDEEYQLVQSDEFKKIIYQCIVERLNADDKTRTLLMRKELPFAHYYVMGGRIIDESNKYQWLLNIFEHIHKKLNEL